MIVYDQFGLPRYVLSPEATERMTSYQYFPTDELVKKYCYYYEYNAKHQLIKKQLPGQDYILYGYDTKERLRLKQDGRQRSVSWSFVNYDNLGRVINSGISPLLDPIEIPDEITNTEKSTTDIFLSYTYYDTYSFVTDPKYNFDAASAFDAKSEAVKGMTTGSKVRELTDNGTTVWLTTVMYYDQYGRVIQTIAGNHLGGLDISNRQYNFVGELLQSKQIHTVTGQSPKYLVYLYTYDPQGRLLKTELSQNQDGSNAVILNQLTYNDLGEISKKQLHSENGGQSFLQDVNYTFDIKGRMTDMNNIAALGTDLFAMKLDYQQDNNISAQQWNSAKSTAVKKYDYSYDGLNRLTHAVYTPGTRYDELISYDKNGNITALERNGQILTTTKSGGQPNPVSSYGLIDNLAYTYEGNQVTVVTDAVQGINTLLNNDFRGSVTSPMRPQYLYDANGNMTFDQNKGITVTYNALDQPAVVAKDANNRTKYLYDAAGRKLRTEVYENGLLKTTTDYCGPLVYENNIIQYIQTSEGRIAYLYTTVNTDPPPTKGSTTLITVTKRFEYFLTDHLGNTRVVFTKSSNNTAVTVQEDHYYAFGLQMSGAGYTNSALLNKYLFNGKEKQVQTGMYDYGFRQLDPVLGRWFCVDKLAEKYYSESPYSYAGNDPVNQVDFMGLSHGVDFSNFLGGYWQRNHGEEGHGGGSGYWSPIHLNMAMGGSGDGGFNDDYVNSYIAAQNNSSAPFTGTYGQFVQMMTNPGSLGGDNYEPYYRTVIVGAGKGGSWKNTYSENRTTGFAGWRQVTGGKGDNSILSMPK